jgi:hypothetical protein
MSTEYARLLNALPRPDLYDSWELVKRHMPVEQPPSAASYIVFKKGGQCYAKNGMTGHIEFGPGNDSTVIQSALNALTPNRTWKEKVLCKGNFSISTKLSVPAYTLLEIQGKLTLANGVNDNVISIDGTYSEVAGGEIDGNKTNQTAGYGIYVNADFATVRDLIVRNAYGWGVYVNAHQALIDTVSVITSGNGFFGHDGKYNQRFQGCLAWDNNAYGFNIGGVATSVIGCHAHYNNMFGFCVSHSEITLSACMAWYNELHGFYIPTNGSSIIGCQGCGNTRCGFYITGNRNRVIGGAANDNSYGSGNSYHGIYIAGSENEIIGVYMARADPFTQGYGVYIEATGNGNKIFDNIFVGNALGAVNDLGTNTKFRKNTGYVTENSGTAVGTGSQQAIAHGCNFTPTKASVIVGNIDDGANPYLSADPDATNIYVTAVNGKTFRWEVKYNP